MTEKKSVKIDPTTHCRIAVLTARRREKIGDWIDRALARAIATAERAEERRRRGDPDLP